MKTKIQSETTTLALVLALVLTWFGPSRSSQATDLGSVLPNGNTADGSGVLSSRTTGIVNSGFGFQSLFYDTTGSYNTATGYRALFHDTSGYSNTADGYEALYSDTTGIRNTAVGNGALLYNNASSSTAVGWAALFANTSGGQNTATGYQALFNNISGFQNTALGFAAGDNVTTASGVTCLGAGVVGADVSNTTWIGNVYGVTTVSSTTLPVIVSQTGQLGTNPSSARFKKDIKPMEETSEAILQLRPVRFHYKADGAAVPQFGLVAEEVEKINPDLVVKDTEGKVFSVRYDAVNVMLLNEFLKEHCRVEELESKAQEQEQKTHKQEAMIAQQQRQIEALSVGLQKVNAKIELETSAARLTTSK